MGAAVIAAGVWLYQHFNNKDTQMAIYIVLGTGGGVAIVAILILVGACKRNSACGRCMLYILCVIVFLAIAVELAAVGGVYKYSGCLPVV